MTIAKTKEKLFDLAKAAFARAYAPYSDFRVGAAILSSNGNFYSGCNVENISYPCGTCAETGAVSAMICGGDSLIEEILILAGGGSLIKPCGACLQRIKEFSGTGTKIHLASPDGIICTCTLEQMLPMAFNVEELKK